MESKKSVRPWDSYPLWKKILVSPLIIFAGGGAKKVTVFGLVLMFLGGTAWSFNATLYPFVMCLEEMDEERDDEIGYAKNITLYEKRFEDCMHIQKCLGQSSSKLLKPLIIGDNCDDYWQEP